MTRNTIHISDNCVGGKVIDSPNDIDNLSTFLNKDIRQLAEEENLLIFPYSLSDYGDELGQQCVGELRFVDHTAKIVTGNIMGFVGKADTQLRIHSRFGNECNDYFLFYMLCKVLSINVFDLPYSSGQDSALDMLLLLFPHYLSNAMRQGLYREYRTYEYNDSNVRGVVDINRHINRNIPFLCNIAYKKRERSADNQLTELIRHTIEYMRHHHLGMAILEKDMDIRTYVDIITECTPTYNPRDRVSVINANLRPKVHPYYWEYSPLQQLCLRILRHEEVSMGNNSTQIYGILFDGAWLWEEYLDKVIHKHGFVHPHNKIGEGHISLFTDGSGIRYPDFYHPATKVVLDAKYKRMSGHAKVSDTDRNDIHQLISYMHILESEIGGFLFPCPMDDCNHLTQSELKGYGGVIRLIPFHIPNDDKWKSFAEGMRKSEESLSLLIQPLSQTFRNTK